ncbi:hypothetical protein AQF52_1340 [Streptomyces venezuelae]|uniref:DUF6114 domain-containing protein n=1 Tax=Streptomyces gardneri TaxID=66892 RepID=UPI0006BCDA63|nr:DUF6114 domain-containing protein [Streptomyces gardneri]ALO06936.1 hypothetical protein AQF52_1340 [Streptomyces venezuelae]WRK35600.1 DUF6114 domain-containing protein [Streptomyces venezuelae]CUM42766.1 hypothetical protein BN2537_14497 [Streptomyces venezuelae]
MLSGAARGERAERADRVAPVARAAAAARAARVVGVARERCGRWVRWFGAFRRTRPFWGGLWLIAGGWTVLKFSLSSLQLIVSTGFGGVAGYLVGGGMILCGLIPMALPAQRYTFGLIGTVLAVVSLVVSNLGGFLVGMALGVLGGSMTVGWGAKRPRRGAVEG